MTTSIISLVIAAVFIGALTRSTFGFGEAVVSMPLLALLPIQLHTAVSLIGLAGLTVAALSVSTSWRSIDGPILIRIACATLIGIPAGLVIIHFAPVIVITTLLGLFLFIYGTYSLTKPFIMSTSKQKVLDRPNWSLVFGFLAGMLGSAYNFNGVPIVVYGTLRRWDPPRFRGMLQVHFLFSGILVVSGQAFSGLWTKDLLILYGFSLPAILLATVLGGYLHRRIPSRKFERYVFVLIVLLGALLLVHHS